MKRLSLVLVSVALMLGMAQCKKNVKTVTPVATGEPMSISLDVTGGSKVGVDPSTGIVTFSIGDKIYVAYNGTYAGYLEYNGTNFTGEISATGDGTKYLYFYFLGNLTPNEATPGSSISVNIDDQTSGAYPVISAAPSNEYFSPSRYTYTATLLNKCALVKFNITTSASSSVATCIKGVNNKVSFTFNASSIGTPVYSKTDGGVIQLAGGDGEKWAILLPQDANSGVFGSAYSYDKSYYGTCALPAISANDYIDEAIEVTIDKAASSYVALSGSFTVNGTGSTVHFAPGNLQYVGSTGTWQFAASQLTKLGNVAANSSPTSSGTMDLFGWGTSGYNSIYPYTSGNDNAKYAYPGAATNIAGTDYDWGVYNAISNGGNEAGLWRTLTYDEWNYLLNTRTGITAGSTSNTARFVKAQINTDGTAVNGLIIFPDGFNQTSVTGVTSWGTINGTGNGYTATVTSAGWTTLESLGCVFLPAGGYRNGSSVLNDGTYGSYWSSTASGTTSAHRLGFNASNLNLGAYSRYDGYSVRLVCE